MIPNGSLPVALQPLWRLPCYAQPAFLPLNVGRQTYDKFPSAPQLFEVILYTVAKNDPAQLCYVSFRRKVRLQLLDRPTALHPSLIQPHASTPRSGQRYTGQREAVLPPIQPLRQSMPACSRAKSFRPLCDAPWGQVTRLSVLHQA